jgi:hypothetical protein
MSTDLVKLTKAFNGRSSHPGYQAAPRRLAQINVRNQAVEERVGRNE